MTPRAKTRVLSVAFAAFLVARLPAQPGQWQTQIEFATSDECAIEQVHQVDGEVRAPILITRVEPKASSAAPCRGLVSLRLLIDSCGSVREVEDLSRNPDAFTRSWAEAASRWKFRPATLREETVAVWWFTHINIKCA